MAVSTRSILRQGFALAFGATLLGACVVDPTTSTGDDRVTDQQADAPTRDQIADDGAIRVCTGEKHCYTRVKTDENGQRKRALATAAGWGATDIQKAYGITNTGSTGIVAVVDAYGYSALEADLAVYRSQYGLPACTKASGCLTIVNQTGSTSSLPSNAPSSDDWTAETALDVDMASSGCPSCKILVVQATNDSGDGLDIANNTAASMGAAVISNSWGGAESSGVTSEETYFNHPGIAIFVAAGDNGYTGSSPDYPSTSAHTIAVGGTTLASSSGSRGYSETAWNDGGSSCSKYIAMPSWQTSTTKCSGSKRMASDVSAVANGSEGIAIYDSLNGNGGWTQVEGTSAASPLVASIYAATHHGAATAQYAYQNPTAYYDVTSGTNGSCSSDKICTAGTGWDGPTGIGSPNFASLEALSTGAGSGSGSMGTGSGSDSSTGSGSNDGSGSNEGSGSGSNEGSGSDGEGTGTGTCGNGVIDDGEQCDNGDYNGTPGNSCTADCQLVGGTGDNGGGSSGGGCASTDGQGAASMALVLGFALIRRRRRS